MIFCTLVASIDFNDVAKALEGVEGEADRQGNRQYLRRVCPSEVLCQGYQVGTAKIQIFEDE